jgi:hypothetical protein
LYEYGFPEAAILEIRTHSKHSQIPCPTVVRLQPYAPQERRSLVVTQHEHHSARLRRQAGAKRSSICALAIEKISLRRPAEARIVTVVGGVHKGR